MKSNDFLKQQIASIIVEYLIAKHMTLNGMYEDMDVKQFEVLYSRMRETRSEMYKKLVQLNGIVLILNKNLTFKWITCNKVTHYVRYRIKKNNDYPYKIYEGVYRVFNNKKLSFEVLNDNGRSIKIDGEIVYQTTEFISINVRNFKNLMDSGDDQWLLQKVPRENCKLLKYIKHDKSYEP